MISFLTEFSDSFFNASSRSMASDARLEDGFNALELIKSPKQQDWNEGVADLRLSKTAATSETITVTNV